MAKKVWVRVVGRFKDPNVDAQMNEIVKQANELFGALDTHAGRTDNPHKVTASQVGAETPTGAQSKVNALNESLNPRITTLENQIAMGDYKWVRNVSTGNLELYRGSAKLADIDANGNIRVKGTISQNQTL